MSVNQDGLNIVEMFHSSNSSTVQGKILKEFPKSNSKVRILVATIAFGMGVDIPDVRMVVHFGAPSDILTYHQELGRCARDGLPGIAVMFAYPFSMMKTQTTDDHDLKNLAKTSN